MAKTATKAAAKKAQPATTKAAPAASPSRAATVARPAQKPTPEPKKIVPAVRQQAPPPTAETLASLPAHMRNDVDLGKENIRNEDMDIPRLKLIQGLSKELQLYDDLKAGHFFHSAAETIFDDSFRVVPIYMTREYILWRPLEDGGGILARSTDGVNWNPPAGEFKVKLDRKDGGAEVVWKLAKTVEASGLGNWGTMNPADPNSPPAATLMFNFLLAFPDFPDLMPAVLTFQRSSIKIGRKFLTKLKTVRTPLFGTIFRLSSYDDHNAANQDYKNISIVGDGLVDDPALYEQYKSLWQVMSQRGLNIKDIDSLQNEDDLPGDGGGQQEQQQHGY